MKKVRLGKTELMVTKTSFGALPIQRISMEAAGEILRAAYDAGVNFYDTANAYTDSEAKIGNALGDVREKIVIATKSAPVALDRVKRNLENSLEKLKTDYIDIFQIHNAPHLYRPGDPDGLYDYLLEMKAQGVIRHIGITAHRLDVAWDAVHSGLYETLQYPFSVLASQKDLDLVEGCRQADMGFIAMKAMSGGLIQNPAATFAFLQQFDHVVPIYGIQRMSELQQWLELDAAPPAFGAETEALIRKEREELAGDFCRSCGYCLPCPAEIPIPNAARISFLMTRAPYQGYLSKEWREQMDRIENCLHCNACASRCPFSLDTPALLQRQLGWYNEFYEAHKEEAEA